MMIATSFVGVLIIFATAPLEAKEQAHSMAYHDKSQLVGSMLKCEAVGWKKPYCFWRGGEEAVIDESDHGGWCGVGSVEACVFSVFPVV